jgi:hypothetical protein
MTVCETAATFARSAHAEPVYNAEKADLQAQRQSAPMRQAQDTLTCLMHLVDECSTTGSFAASGEAAVSSISAVADGVPSEQLQATLADVQQLAAAEGEQLCFLQHMLSGVLHVLRQDAKANDGQPAVATAAGQSESGGSSSSSSSSSRRGALQMVPAAQALHQVVKAVVIVVQYCSSRHRLLSSMIAAGPGTAGAAEKAAAGGPQQQQQLFGLLCSLMKTVQLQGAAGPGTGCTATLGAADMAAVVAEAAVCAVDIQLQRLAASATAGGSNSRPSHSSWSSKLQQKPLATNASAEAAEAAEAAAAAPRFGGRCSNRRASALLMVPWLLLFGRCCMIWAQPTNICHFLKQAEEEEEVPKWLSTMSLWLQGSSTSAQLAAAGLHPAALLQALQETSTAQHCSACRTGAAVVMQGRGPA